MPAFEHQRVGFRHEAQRHDTERFDLRLQRAIDMLAHAVEDHALDAAVRTEIQKAFERRKRGKALPAAVDDQHNRRGERLCDGVGACLVACRRESVVIAHDALDHGAVGAVRVLRVQPPQLRFVGKEQIERAGSYADHAFMKQRIDVVRSALERGHGFAAVLERAQNPADDRGLAAAGRGRGEQYARAMHRLRPPRRKRCRPDSARSSCDTRRPCGCAKRSARRSPRF